MNMKLLPTAILLAGTISTPTPTPAHEWYPLACCGGQDCTRVDGSKVHQVNSETYEVTLGPNDLPVFQNLPITDPMVFTFHGQPAISPDGEYHVCVTVKSFVKREIVCMFEGGVS